MIMMKHRLLKTLPPFMAGVLHLQVFFHALQLLILSSFVSSNHGNNNNNIINDNNNTIQPHHIDNQSLFQLMFNMERAVFLAYTFDLICCYVFDIIPFSRCHSKTDIVQHHLPIILFILPLGIPLWTDEKLLRNLDPIVHGILESNITISTHTGDDITPLRIVAIKGLYQANGWGFISSLNECIMCFQRVEMIFNGIQSFKEISELSKDKKVIMTGTFIIGIELYFKLAIFTIFSVCSFMACFELDHVWYLYHIHVHKGDSMLDAMVGSFPRSAIMVRLVLFRFFMLVLYPFMAMRTIGKIRKIYQKAKNE